MGFRLKTQVFLYKYCKIYSPFFASGPPGRILGVTSCFLFIYLFILMCCIDLFKCIFPAHLLLLLCSSCSNFFFTLLMQNFTSPPASSETLQSSFILSNPTSFYLSGGQDTFIFFSSSSHPSSSSFRCRLYFD